MKRYRVVVELEIELDAISPEDAQENAEFPLLTALEEDGSVEDFDFKSVVTTEVRADNEPPIPEPEEELPVQIPLPLEVL